MAPKGPIQAKGIPLEMWTNNEKVLAQQMAAILAAFYSGTREGLKAGVDFQEQLACDLTRYYAEHLLARHKDFSLIVVPPAAPPTGEPN